MSGELTMSEYTANDGTKKTNLELNATIIDLVGKRDSSVASSDYNAPAPASNYAPQAYQQPAAASAQNYAPPPAPNYAQQQPPKPAATPNFDASYDDDIPF